MENKKIAPEKKIKIIATAVGRRKEAIAAVRLVAGSGEITVNGHPAKEYFPFSTSIFRLNAPFTALSLHKYNTLVSTHGGGKNGQLDATILGISRALISLKAEYKPPLRQLGLVTRDPRIRQRRQVGMGGKSRRKKQSPKR